MKLIQTFQAAVAAALLGAALSASGATTAFVYQGQLLDGGLPATGSYDLQFGLWSDPAAGTNLAFPILVTGVAVSNGVFTTTLDFGGQPFVVSDTWLEVAVSPAGAGTFSTLSPRAAISPVPVAIYAAAASTAVTALNANAAATAAAFSGIIAPSQLSGAIPIALLPGWITNNATGVTLNGAFTGSGAGLTNLSSSAWSWTGTRTLLLAAAAAGEYQMLNTQYNANLTPTNALVLWPDGTYGVWTATNLNANWFTADGYTLTYTNTGTTIAQPTVSRDENGNVTNSPPLVITP